MVTVTWNAPMRFDGQADGGPPVAMDTRSEYGGTGAGPSPMETVLMALAGCTGMDVVSILQKARTPLAALSIEVSGERATEHPRVYTRIHLRYVARGAGLLEAQVRKAVALSQDKYCSVSAMLKKAVEITWDVVVPGVGQPAAG